MNNQATKISDWMLEQYALDEIDESEKQRVKTAIDTDEKVKERFDAILESNEEILAEFPVHKMSVEIKHRFALEQAEKEKTSIFGKLPAMATAASFAVILLVVSFYSTSIMNNGNHEDIIASNQEIIYLKGLEPHLSLYKKADDDATKLEKEVLTKEGDVLQISYIAGEMKYGMIFSIDGRGTVTEHLPFDKDQAELLDNEGEIALKSAYELDDAPDFERFFFVTSNSQFKIGEVKKAALELAKEIDSAKTHNLQLPKNFKQSSFIVMK